MTNSSKTILIIEDHDDIRESTAEILELAGYSTLTAPEGKSGVELALKHLPDLILCDIMMPVLDGYGVLYLLGKHPETAAIPLIYITAKAERSDLRKAMEMGADDYLTKPFDDMELLNAIESRLKKQAIGVASTNEYALSPEDQQLMFDEFIGTGREQVFIRKQPIFREGHDPVFLYQVMKGMVRNYIFHQDGRELTTAVLKAGDFFGYESIIMKTPYKVNTEAMEDTILRLVKKEEFYHFLEKNPGLNQPIIKMLSQNNQEKDEQMLGLAYHSVRKKLAGALVTLAEKFRETPTSDKSTIRISRDDLASITGTANETVSRNISEFIEEGLLLKKGNSIIVCSIEKLKNMKQ